MFGTCVATTCYFSFEMKFPKLRCWWQTLAGFFNEYANYSTIHGVNYLNEKGRSWFERLWWFLAICISLLCCGKLIFDAWNIDPIIITFTGKPTPLWKVSCLPTKESPRCVTKAPKITLFYSFSFI
jgi:Amiloride-sensitive sodium channel